MSRFSSPRSPAVLVLGASGLLLAAFAGALALASRAPRAATVAGATDDLFTLTRIHEIELRFTPDQWKAIEPAGATGGPGGRGGFGPPGFGPPGGGPGGPPGGGPAGFFAQSILRTADPDGSGGISRTEWNGLAAGWFFTWDTAETGNLDSVTLGKGLGSVFGPPGGPGGPGGRGGPGGPSFVGNGVSRNGMAAATGVDYPTVDADLVFDGESYPRVTVRYKGNNTFMEAQGSLKKSLKVDINDHAPGRTLAGVRKLTLQNNVTDAGWMNEVLSYRLFRDAGVPSPRTSYARVYLTVPGEHDRRYLGLYSSLRTWTTPTRAVTSARRRARSSNPSRGRPSTTWATRGTRTPGSTTRRRRCRTMKRSA